MSENSSEANQRDTESKQRPDSGLRAVPLDTQHPGEHETDDDLINALAFQEKFHTRLERLEKQNFRMKLAVVFMVLIVGYLGFDQIITKSTIVRQTLVESRELKLLDNNGNARLFLRMYSRVPVLQLLDTSGKPRLSLGMRFDETPFIDLSDRTGRTRATFEMTEKDEPALRMFDANGEPTFNIN